MPIVCQSCPKIGQSEAMCITRVDMGRTDLCFVVGWGLSSPQSVCCIVHLASVDGRGYLWHTECRPLACPGSKNSIVSRSAATVTNSTIRDDSCYVLYCELWNAGSTQHEMKRSKRERLGCTWAFLASPLSGYLDGFNRRLLFLRGLDTSLPVLTPQRSPARFSLPLL
jgi:hypothetical protein